MTTPVSDAGLRPRRSVLYMPGANLRALEKAKGLNADSLILDLEDAVSPDAKGEARNNVCNAVGNGGYGNRELTIRVNGLGTQWHDDDIRAASQAGPGAIVVPKVNSVYDVQRIEEAMAAANAPQHTKLWAMLETPIAIRDAFAIAESGERLTVFVMGTNDLLKELRAQSIPGRAPLLHALSTCVTAARAAGRSILDGVFNAIDDADGFANECAQGAAFGFDGKTLIHPSQLDAANAAFAPSEAEVLYGRRVIAAFDEALALGKGVATVDGKMIENLHVANAQRAIAMAEAIEAMRA
jgi:citrate lyase subunit beta / citryl-CoA lyase